MNTSAQMSQPLSPRPALYVVRDEPRQGATPSLITPSAAFEFNLGRIPDLRSTCMELFNLYSMPGASQSAIHAIPVLRNIEKLSVNAIESLKANQKKSHILVDNDILKIVLIHWTPGKISSIHGHPKGGCMFKVLQGRLTELRYSNEKEPKLLSANAYAAGDMAYIDDDIGYHAVANPYSASAVSLHVYTYARRRSSLPKV